MVAFHSSENLFRNEGLIAQAIQSLKKLADSDDYYVYKPDIFMVSLIRENDDFLNFLSIFIRRNKILLPYLRCFKTALTPLDPKFGKNARNGPYNTTRSNSRIGPDGLIDSLPEIF